MLISKNFSYHFKTVFLSLIAFFLGSSYAAAALMCDATKLREVLEPATSSRPNVYVNCNLNLNNRDVISKTLIIQGKESTGVQINCNGATLDGRIKGVSRMLIVRPKKVGANFERPSDVVINKCNVVGAIRIAGMDSNANGSNTKASSKLAGHTARAQAAAPKNIQLVGLTITGIDEVPVYVGPGVTRTSIRNSQFWGSSVSTAIYLDAESASNTILNNRFNINTSREIIAIDGSANNVIQQNIFSHLEDGGIYLYRNCGEAGAIRHQTPNSNKIISNYFYYRVYQGSNPAIWLGSRNGGKSYCGDDAGYSFGSSIDNKDHANRNTVVDNQIQGRDPFIFGRAAWRSAIIDNGYMNILTNNLRVNAFSYTSK